jgi:predicted P-loop ATPase
LLSGQPLDKVKDMIRTAADGAGAEKRAGLPKMREVFGKDVTKKVADWLGHKGPQGVEDNVVSLGKDHGFIKGENNQIIRGHPANTRLALFKMGVTLHYNEFSGQIELRGMPSAQLDGDMSDHRAVRLRLLIQERFGFRPSQDAFQDILSDEAHQHSYHPVRDYIDGLRWDGTARIDTWIIDHGGAENTEFNRAVGRLWLIAGVRRIRCPGVKFDTIIVFESPAQGHNKSSAMRVLAVRDEWFTDCLPLGSSAKETIEVSQGIWIVEFGELSGMQRRDRESILTFLSRQEDQARLAYGHYKERVKRQSIGAATTNKEEYLPEEERRLLPVRIKHFDTEKLKLDRDQLWAEAAHYEALKEPITLPENLWPEAAKIRRARRIPNPFFPILQGFLEGTCNRKTYGSRWEKPS